MESGMAEVNGANLYYEIGGKGQPLTLISGGGTLDRRGWDQQFSVFSRQYRVIRYDIRGIGNSSRPREPFSHSRDLYALLKCLDIDKTHIIGLSLGGSVAIDFVLEHPEMADRLILAAAGSSTDAKAEANLHSLSKLSSTVTKEGLPHVIQLILDSGLLISTENLSARETVRRIYQDNHDVFESDFHLVRLWRPAEPPASGRLSAIRAPVLIMVAENDNPAYNAIVETLALRIDGAQRVVINGARHLINLDKPKEFNDAVLDFLGKQ
jgi:pimeloyl-ACP methyl ester carboxylesterase